MQQNIYMHTTYCVMMYMCVFVCMFIHVSGAFFIAFGCSNARERAHAQQQQHRPHIVSCAYYEFGIHME